MPNLPMPEGVTMPDLECVMLDTPLLDVRNAYGEDLNEDDFFYGDVPELKYAQGPVAETEAHVTLLFGIHPSDTYVEDVYTVLEGWDLPDILFNEVEVFPSTVEGQDYKCLVMKVVSSAQLVLGNKKLRELPYTNRFEEYRPHVTLAYLKGSADIEEWKTRMNSAFAFKWYEALGLNLGLDDKEGE